MRQKVEIFLVIVLLAGIVIGSQMAGEYLYETYGMQELETAGEAEQVVIFLDSGHGGFDPGKVGVNDALEKDINLSIAKKVEAYLTAQNLAVRMTREDENGLADSKVEDLKARVDAINQEKPLLAVSIHQNSYPDTSIKGAQVFYYTHSEEGEKAAQIMQQALLVVDPENTRQEKANDTYYMLKKTEVPVIIVECGFLSNPEEADLLITEEYQQKLADAIGEGILEYAEGD